MTLIGIQQRFHEVGRVRLGDVQNGHPHRLDTFRLTSASKSILEAAATVYGGKVEAWNDKWQLTTQTRELRVMVPPRHAVESYSLHYELWTNGGCQRRCDGSEAMTPTGVVDCQCDPENRDCKPTLRVSLLLPDVPGLGTWRLETKGYNAAAELPGALNLLTLASDHGRPIRAVLRLEERVTKRPGQPTKRFAVPVLDIAETLTGILAGDETTQLPAEERLALTTEEKPVEEFDRDAARARLLAASNARRLSPTELQTLGVLVGIQPGKEATPEQFMALIDAVENPQTDPAGDVPTPATSQPQQDAASGDAKEAAVTESPAAASGGAGVDSAPAPRPDEPLEAKISRARERGARAAQPEQAQAGLA